MDPNNFNFMNGYGMGTFRGLGSGLYFRAGNAAGVGINQTLISVLPLNVWYSFRMTVYPIAPLVDRVICEQESSPGSGIWSSTFVDGSGDVVVDGNVAINRYVAWGGSTSNGAFGSPYGGFGGNTTYLDMMQVSLATVPVPIP